ncbi:hypothetical protein LDC_1561 [sediment metagenome]|uniref:EVE domain-containing protein n=1 Tax=sediment metagenome TaxID=749907 RepID=D9PJ52_9ZZZZ
MKTDPEVFSIEDLKNSPDQTTRWDGVRNYQARNFMRDEMRVGDRVLFYHSRTDPAVAGTASVVRSGYPDDTAWDPASKYYDPKSVPQNPIWYMVDIRLEKVFPYPIPLSRLRETPELEGMMLLRKGVRLSVQPVTREAFEIIMTLSEKNV